MKRELLTIAVSLFVGACAASDDAKPEAPAPNVPKPVEQVPPAPPAIKASISSARLVQDCPDPKPTDPKSANESQTEPAPASAPPIRDVGTPVRRSRLAADGTVPEPCTQSAVQIAFTGPIAKATKVEIKEVRLLSAEEALLSTLVARMPSRWQTWQDNGYYDAWDSMLVPNTDNKASYKLSLPDWNEIEKSSGKSSYGPLYMLEVDIDIGGTTTTIRSPQFERARPQVIVT